MQVVGPRVPQNCLGHWDDENLDVVDTEIESWFQKISQKCVKCE